jgi:hypothetical protein
MKKVFDEHLKAIIEDELTQDDLISKQQRFKRCPLHVLHGGYFVHAHAQAPAVG